MSKLFDYQSAEARLALADAVKAALAETYEKLHEAQLRELTRLTEHLTKAPRSTWRVAALTGSNTPDVAVEFPAQVAYIDNASTAAVQVRAPGDIAPSPPIPAGGQGVWLMPGATQLTVSGTGTGQVRIRFLNDAAARLLWQAPPSSVTAGGATQVALTGSLPAGTNTLGTVNVTGSGTTVPYLDIEGAPGVSVAAGATYQTPTLGTVAGFQGVWSVSAAWSAATTGNAYIHYPLPTGYQGIQLASIGSATADWFVVATGQAGATTTHAPLQPIVYVTSDGLLFNNSGASAVTLNKYQGLIY